MRSVAGVWLTFGVHRAGERARLVVPRLGRLEIDAVLRDGTPAEGAIVDVYCRSRMPMTRRLRAVADATGRLVFAAGRLTYWSHEGTDGRQRRTAEVTVSELILLDRRPEGESSAVATEAEVEDARPS